MVRLMLFHLVESLAIDTNHGTLRYEGMRVNHVDDVEDARRLVLAGEHKQHLHLVTAVETLGIDDRTAAQGLGSDVLCYLLVLVGDDEELHRRAHGVDEAVDTEGRDEKYHITVDHLLPAAQHEVAGGDDNEVADEDDAPQRDVVVFVHHGGNQVRAARAASRLQSHSRGHAQEAGTHHGCHERLVA